MTDQKITAEEIIYEWRKGRISASLRDGMLRAEGYELAKDSVVGNIPEWRKRLTARDETSRIQTNEVLPVCGTCGEEVEDEGAHADYTGHWPTKQSAWIGSV